MAKMPTLTFSAEVEAFTYGLKEALSKFAENLPNSVLACYLQDGMLVWTAGSVKVRKDGEDITEVP